MTCSSRVEKMLIFIRMSTINPVLRVHAIDKSFLKMEEEVFLLNNYLFIKAFTWLFTPLLQCSQLPTK